MIKAATLRKMALSLSGASEEPHFKKTSFRAGKKIFATYDDETGEACLKLPMTEQDVFSLYDKEAIFPVPGKWGTMGWTSFRLSKVRKDMLEDALKIAYDSVAPKKPKTASTSRKASEKEALSTKASDTDAVDSFMRSLDHPMHDVAAALRKLIMATDKSIGEEIAWNAPAFFFTGPMKPFKPKEYKRHLVVFNLFKKDQVRLVFLQGASVNDTSGLLEGTYTDGRRLASFHSIKEVKDNEKTMRSVVQQLLQQMNN